MLSDFLERYSYCCYNGFHTTQESKIKYIFNSVTTIYTILRWAGPLSGGLQCVNPWDIYGTASIKQIPPHTGASVLDHVSSQMSPDCCRDTFPVGLSRERICFFFQEGREVSFRLQRPVKGCLLVSLVLGQKRKYAWLTQRSEIILDGNIHRSQREVRYSMNLKGNVLDLRSGIWHAFRRK